MSSSTVSPKIEAGGPQHLDIPQASLWTIAGYFFGQVLRLIGNVILARFLFPEAFGLMALVNTFILGLEMLSDLGIEVSVIQNPRDDDRDFLDTAWTLQAIRGAGIWFAAWVIAWPAAILYQQSQLLSLIPASGFVAVLLGFHSTEIHILRRRLKTRTLVLLNTTAQIVGLIVTCVWALQSPSVWAFVAGRIAASLTMLAFSHLQIPQTRHRFRWHCASRQTLLHFGKWIFVSTMFTFLAANLDRILLGKLTSIHTLGLYSVALAIASLPSVLINQLSQSVLYPVLAHETRLYPETFKSSLTIARSVLLSFGAFLVLAVITQAELFFSLLYDERYQAATRITQMISCAVWIEILSVTLSRALLVLTNSRSVAFYNLTRFICSAGISVLGFQFGGLTGFILGLAVGSLCGHVVLLTSLWSHGIYAVTQDLKVTAFLALAVLSAFCVNQAGGWFVSGAERYASLVVLVLVGWRVCAQARTYFKSIRNS